MRAILSIPRRIHDYLTGPRNRAGTALGLTGVLLHVVGFVDGPLWWVVVVGLYGTGVGLGAWSESLRHHRERQIMADGVDVEAIRSALSEQFRAISGRVPGVAMERFLHIRKAILALLPRTREFPPGSVELFTLQQTALDYLPGALRPYLQLPPAYAMRGGLDGSKTPYLVLVEELGLLAEQMDGVTEAVRRHDAERLLVHQRFLKDRFGDRPSSGLSLPPPTEGAAEGRP
jgi:hypothetical protein